METLFDKHARTRDSVWLEVDRFYINGTHVCMAWYGGEDKDRMACQFLLARHFGSIPVCGLTGQDMISEPNVLNPAPDWCPLKG